jgi:hypothetical protein
MRHAEYYYSMILFVLNSFASAKGFLSFESAKRFLSFASAKRFLKMNQELSLSLNVVLVRLCIHGE